MNIILSISNYHSILRHNTSYKHQYFVVDITQVFGYIGSYFSNKGSTISIFCTKQGSQS